MKRCLILIALLSFSSVLWAAKPWEKGNFTKWSEKDAKQILEVSPWVSTFQLGDTGTVGKNVLSGNEGLANEREFVIIIRIRLFSSPVIRQAFVVTAAKGNTDKLNRMKNFATRAIEDEIIFSWEIDSKPKGVSSAYELERVLQKLLTLQINGSTFLVTSGGTKVFLKEYIPPTPDGTGAKFVFSRTLPDGTPLIKPDDKWIRFQADGFVVANQSTSVDATFKLKDLIFNGTLVY